MEYGYRIKANVGVDQVLNVNLKQDIDIYELLSLELKQENLYKLFPDGNKNSSSRGVVVGRVLANDAFGVPNAKVTAFIPLSDVDGLRQDIRGIYPYKSVTGIDKRNVRFNTLPNYKKSDCHQEVGSFPKKQLVLDDDSVLEVYDKYYKYTTITNKAGDYMIFGLPIGEQIIHIDVDLSDIGILSQEPRDFIYKGYSPDLFESPTQFKKSTNLDDLAQIQSQTATVTVYPLWGDKNAGEIAITRKDINLQYKFEPTCVFLGSVITDNSPNSISHNCVPDESVGEASQLGPSKGNIEMIRKTIEDKVEEYPIKGNQLIDGDGTWCYQIPMNLDYVGMDEYGNIVPTNNPNKGIPTRARVRFRITLDETGDDSLTRHKARYLIPNNPELYHGYLKPTIHKDKIDKDLYYEFGTLTPEDCFRDLYWNKVYSIKNYIPRLQMSAHEKSSNYLAIKGVNKRDARKNNPIPFNKLNLNISIPAYNTLYTIGFGHKGLSGFWRYLRSYSIPFNIDNIREKVLDDMDGIGLDFYNDWLNGCLYFPSWFWHIRQKKKYKEGESEFDSLFCECKKEDSDAPEGQLFLYNNCSLVYGGYDSDSDDLYKLKGEDLVIKNDYKNDDLYKYFNKMYTTIPFGTKNIYSGIIKKKKTKDGLEVFYYSFGNKLKNKLIDANMEYNSKLSGSTLDEEKPTDGKDYYEYARLFSTDIILLGSLKDCDIDGVPKIGFDIPSTTANIPVMGRYKRDYSEWPEEVEKQTPTYSENDMEEGIMSHNGMNWGDFWDTTAKGHFMKALVALGRIPSYKYQYSSGLFFGLTAKKIFQGFDWITSGTLGLADWMGTIIQNVLKGAQILLRTDIIPYSDLKTCVNAERISELGVTFDSEVKFDYDGVEEGEKYTFVSEMDGLITKREMTNVDSRALFATLNFRKLKGIIENDFTGYKKYLLTYIYPTNFDGRMGDKIFNFESLNGDDKITGIAEIYTRGITTDDRNKDYLDFRFGSNSQENIFNRKTADTTGTNGGGISASGGRKYGGKRAAARAASNEENLAKNSYTVQDGYVDVAKQIIPRTRHFYGYDNTSDRVYPLLNNRIKFADFPYAFPLYENSFYFYYGINQGSTAIDKFYENFYSKCPVQNEKPFILEAKTTAATACDSESGVIKLNTQEAIYPYDVDLIMGDDVIDSKTGLMKDDVTFTGLTNGTYRLIVTDSYGSSMYEDVVLKYDKIELYTTLIHGILTEYLSHTCDEICKNDYHAQLSIDKYILYGEEFNVSTLEGSHGVYKIGTYKNNDIIMQIYPNNGESFDDYVCSCTTETIDNIINIMKPGDLTIKVYEKCGNVISENISYYSLNVSDTKTLEMYINDVPLKYIVGEKEDLLPYNKFFHNNGEKVGSVSDVSISGWFGVHNPDVYAEIFREPTKTDKYKVLWGIDTNKESTMDFLKFKFEYMFNLSKGAYVTAGGKNSFEVYVNGGSGNILQRTSMPKYKNFSEFNTEKEGQFKTYLTDESVIAEVNEFNANIVSENYRYVNNKNEKFPEDAAHVVIGEAKMANPFDFNPKYEDKVNKAANYFAGFDNNANIVETGDDTCEQRDDYKPYQVIPYKAHDLYEEPYNMCLLSQKDSMLDPVFKPVTDAKGNPHFKYFRTEFIDRRFDYNAFFITGHRGIHFDIDEYEKELIKEDSCGESTAWDKGRMSAQTYNGIEMLYKYDGGDKIIISQGDNTEYNYTPSTAEAKLILDQPKRFFESKLFYGDGKYVDLITAYHYKYRTPNCDIENDIYYYNDKGARCQCQPINSDDVSGKEYYNFGLVGVGNNDADGDVLGYPSKRWLHFYKVPYGDFYEFKNVSCSYNNIEIQQTQQGIIGKVNAGEEVNFKIEAGELINLKTNYFEIDCKQGHYNIKYKFDGGGQCVKPYSIFIYDLPFQIDPVGSDGFRSKIKPDGLGINVCWDVAKHPKLEKVKSITGMSDLEAYVSGEWNRKRLEDFDKFDTSEEFKNHIFNASGTTLLPSDQFINMVFDRYYYSKAADSLMKRIRVLNTSTIYCVPDFTFCYERHATVSDSFIIPSGTIETISSVEASGDTPTTGGGSITVDGYGDGWNVNDVEGKIRHDYTEFSFSSMFLAYCMNRVCFRISFMGETKHYKLDDNNVGIIDKKFSSGYVKIGIIWSQHKNLLEDNPGEKARIIVYMDIENEIKAKHDDGHMEFAFGYVIQGTDINIINWEDPSYGIGGGMSIIEDTPATGVTNTNS